MGDTDITKNAHILPKLYLKGFLDNSNHTNIVDFDNRKKPYLQTNGVTENGFGRRPYAFTINTNGNKSNHIEKYYDDLENELAKHLKYTLSKIEELADIKGELPQKIFDREFFNNIFELIDIFWQKIYIYKAATNEPYITYIQDKNGFQNVEDALNFIKEKGRHIFSLQSIFNKVDQINLGISFGIIKGSSRFIVSDFPLYFFHKSQGVGLSQISIEVQDEKDPKYCEITLPLSNNIVLILNNVRSQRKLLNLIDTEYEVKQAINEVNKKTIANMSRFFTCTDLTELEYYKNLYLNNKNIYKSNTFLTDTLDIILQNL